MYIAILGRQPALGMAELEHLYGPEHTQWFSDQTALIRTDSLAFERLGGAQKAGYVVHEFTASNWHQVSRKIVQAYTKAWSSAEAKLTLGISTYGFAVSPREVQQTGIILKQKLKQSGVSLRLVPNAEPALNTATSHHNKLGLSANKIELLIVKTNNGKVVIAESIGAQNITALALRDQGRPKRDAFVGMLPPKLAQIMINLATTVRTEKDSRHKLERAQAQPSYSSTINDKYLQPEREPTPGLDITPGAKPFVIDSGRRGEQNENQIQKNPLKILDPFCGTGVILQEAALMGYNVYGTDLSEKMIDYARINLDWLQATHHISIDITLHQGDAMTTVWQPPIDAVVGESYLGQPFSAPPSPAKLDQVKRTCEHIISSFLKNIAPQLQSGTSLTIAVPAWRDTTGRFTHLTLTKELHKLGFALYKFTHIDSKELLYYREDQVVARELLVLVKA